MHIATEKRVYKMFTATQSIKEKRKSVKRETAHMSFNWNTKTTRGLPRWHLLHDREECSLPWHMSSQDRKEYSPDSLQHGWTSKASWRWDMTTTCCMIQFMSNGHDRQSFSDRSRHTVGTGGDCQCVDSFQGGAENDKHCTFSKVRTSEHGDHQSYPIVYLTKVLGLILSPAETKLSSSSLVRGDDQSHWAADLAHTSSFLPAWKTAHLLTHPKLASFCCLLTKPLLFDFFIFNWFSFKTIFFPFETRTCYVALAGLVLTM